MTTRDRDPGLDTLLALHGQTLFVDEVGHWVKFIVLRTEATPEQPHGLTCSLTLHAPHGARLVGFDNAHPVRERHGPGTRPRFSRISGRKWMRFCRKEERFHEDTEDRYRRL